MFRGQFNDFNDFSMHIYMTLYMYMHYKYYYEICHTSLCEETV